MIRARVRLRVRIKLALWQEILLFFLDTYGIALLRHRLRVRARVKGQG